MLKIFEKIKKIMFKMVQDDPYVLSSIGYAQEHLISLKTSEKVPNIPLNYSDIGNFWLILAYIFLVQNSKKWG